MDLQGLTKYRLEWVASFLAVVDNGGFAAAAAATYRSQPQISAHIAGLEGVLGALLFDRRERPVRLTESGVAFLEHARRTFSALQAGESAVQGILGLLQGTVSLGCYPSAAAGFAPALLGQFLTLYPGVGVRLVELPSEELSEALTGGKADIAIRPTLPSVSETTLRSVALWEERFVAVVPVGHGLAKCREVSASQLVGQPLITAGRHPAPQVDEGDELSHLFGSTGASPTIVLRSNHPQTLIELAKAGLGVAVLNQLATSVSNMSGVVSIPIAEGSRLRTVSLFWDSARSLSPAAQALMRLATQVPPPKDAFGCQELVAD